MPQVPASRKRKLVASDGPKAKKLGVRGTSPSASPLSQIPPSREWTPEAFPDLDFHQSYGSYLTHKNPISTAISKDIARYWRVLSTTPALLQHYVHDIEDKYREAFREFFAVDPISLHGHVSDASNVYILTSLLMHITANATIDDIFFFSDKATANPRVAVTSGYYGAGFGPLAHVSIVRDKKNLASGTAPFVIDTQIPSEINDQVRKAKAAGCTTLIAEIVRSANGTVVSALSWRRLLEACKRHTLVFVVDEAMTAVCCGAPFAHQLPKYQKYGLPDLILFGKGVKTNGIAIEWDGINIHNLGITHPNEREYTIASWQERLTEPAPPAELLISWGTLLLATAEDWPNRAKKIGRILREFIVAEGITEPSIGGLHSMIYLRQETHGPILWPVIGANAGNFVRWLSTMDEVMTSKTELCSKIFGPESIPHRHEVAAWLKSKGLELRRCSRCGVAIEVGTKVACKRCVVNKCEKCEPGEHECPLKEFDADNDSSEDDSPDDDTLDED